MVEPDFGLISHTAGIDAAPKVLVVDDDPAQRKLCAAHLERDGYEVVHAGSGPEALERVAVDCPDVIILDVLMPGMDGLECVKRLRELPAGRHVPVIMASAADHEQDVLAGLEAGADEYVTKPMNPRLFLLRVRSMVRLRRAYTQLQTSADTLSNQNYNLGILLDLSCDMNVELGVDTITQRTLAAAAELTGCRQVSLLLPHESTPILRVAASIGLDVEAIELTMLATNEGIAARAFRAVHALVYDDMHRLVLDRHHSEIALLPTCPALAAPLRTTDQTVGLLTMSGREADRPFTVQEIACLDMITHIAAVTIQAVLTQKARDDAQESIVIALAKLAEHRDDDTGRHVERVTEYALTLARELRRREKYVSVIDDEFLDSMTRAVPLHDIGKVAIPDAVLLKPGKLTAEERAIMCRHVEVGAETIRSVLARAPDSRFLKLAEQVCRCHHEWWNGAGYPAGLCGTNIPLAARIAAIADVYDALTTERVYKAAMPHEKAYNIIVNSSGTQFDPEIVQAFIDREQDFIHLSRQLADRRKCKARSAPPARPVDANASDG